jgi:hypothetical protein
MQAGVTSGSVRLSQLTKPFLKKNNRLCVCVCEKKDCWNRDSAGRGPANTAMPRKSPSPTFQWWIRACSGRKTTTLKTQIYSFTCKESKVVVECLSVSSRVWVNLSIRTPVILARGGGGGVPHPIEASAGVTAQSRLQTLLSTPLLNIIY